MTNVKLSKKIETVKRQECWIERALARLEKRRMRVKQRERKARDKRVIGLGELGWIAGVLKFDESVLLGALLSAATLRGDAKWQDNWVREGEIATIDWEEGGRTAAMREDYRNLGMGDIASVISRRTHLQARLGGILEKTGWGDESPQLILGLLLTVKRGLGKPEKVREWEGIAVAHAVAQRASVPKKRTTKPRAKKVEAAAESPWVLGNPTVPPTQDVAET